MKKTNKLWLALLLTVLVAALLAVGFTAAAEEPEIVDSGTSWTRDSNGLLILNSTGGLYDTLFEGRTDVKNVVILDGEDMIDAGMFAGCSNLKSIAIPTSVEIIEISAFDGCSALSYVFYSGTPEQWDQIWIYGYLEDMDDAHAAYAQSVRDHLNAIVRFNTVDWGYCGGEGDGTNLVWTLDNAGTLTISGTGAMANYSDSEPAPWSDCFAAPGASITVVLEEGVTTIGTKAFPNTGLNELIVLNKDCDLSALEIRDPAVLRGYLESTAKDYAEKYDKLSTFKPLCDVDYRHTVEVIEGVDSTCREPGHTPGLRCVECDKYFYGCEALPLENHAWGDWVTTKQPTTETEGVRTRTCTTPGCGATETQTIEKLTPTDNGGNDNNDSNDNGGGFFGWLQQAMKGLVAWFKKLLQFFK